MELPRGDKRVIVYTNQCFFWGFEPRGELRGGSSRASQIQGGGDLLRGERGKFETSVLVLRGAARRPQKMLAPFGGLTRFPLHFQSILRRLEGLKRLKTHDERLPPHRLLAGAKGGAQGGADRYPRIQGGSSPPVPPCRGGAWKHCCTMDPPSWGVSYVI